MRIFDNVLLKQYIDVGADLKVYANDDWYTISDKSDVADSIDAVGQDEYGAPHRFGYQDIKQIKVNGDVITLEMLATKFGDVTTEPSGDGGSKPKGDDLGGGGDEEEPTDEPKPPKDDKGPDLSWFSPAYDVGRILMKEKEERNKKRGNKI